MGMRISIAGPLFLSVIKLLLMFGNVSIIRSIGAKNSPRLAAKPCLNAGHDVRQMRLGDLVVRLSSILFGGEQAAPLHKPQVFGGHVAGDFARLGQFAHRVPPSKEHLDHSQAMRVGDGLEALSRLLQGLQGSERHRFRLFGFSGHRLSSLLNYIGTLRHVN